MDIAPGDFTQRPWTYSGADPAGGGLLEGTRFHPLPPGGLDRALARADATPVRDRNLVVAVGSNASPAVLLGKLASAGVTATVPFVEGEVVGLRVGHSAHVSRAGYLAAAPVRAPGARTSVTALLLDDEQVGCLDQTEPNYIRRLLPATCARSRRRAVTSPRRSRCTCPYAEFSLRRADRRSA